MINTIFDMNHLTLPPKSPTARIIHISHNDLDGFASQFVISRAYYNVCWFNCDYKDIDTTISQALKQIKMEFLSGNPPALLLITDINLSMATAYELEKQLKKNRLPTEVLVLDHHGTASECAKKFSWYHLDISVCATQLCFRWISGLLEDDARNFLADFSDLVGVTDLWQSEHKLFRYANLLADLIFLKSPFSWDMIEEHRDYLFHLMNSVFEKVRKNATVLQVEKDLYDIQLAFLLDSGLSKDVVYDPMIGIEEKFHQLILKHILSKHTLPKITIANRSAVIFFRWQGTMFQHVSSMFLSKKPEIDIAIRVGANARLSLRSHKTDIDLGILAKQYFGGGGHPQASGGKLQARELSNYKAAVSLLKSTIEKIEGGGASVGKNA